jgi:hypothetical protein
VWASRVDQSCRAVVGRRSPGPCPWVHSARWCDSAARWQLRSEPTLCPPEHHRDRRRPPGWRRAGRSPLVRWMGSLARAVPIVCALAVCRSNDWDALRIGLAIRTTRLSAHGTHLVRKPTPSPAQMTPAYLRCSCGHRIGMGFRRPGRISCGELPSESGVRRDALTGISDRRGAPEPCVDWAGRATRPPGWAGRDAPSIAVPPRA